MRRVYAVASAKGGVGKTTTTANLGAALADAGSSVVVVDADLGMPNLGGALGVDGGPTIHDALSGEVDAVDAVHEGAGGVAVVPGSADIDDFRAADPAGLERVVADLADEYDYVLLDSGAGLNHDSLVPLSVADSVVLVTGTGRDARGDTAKTREVADRLGTPVAGVVVARGGGDGEGLAGFEDLPLLATVPESTAVAAATEAGEPVVLSDPDDPAAVAYRAAAAALTDRESVAATDDGVAADVGEAEGDESDEEVEASIGGEAEESTGAETEPDADDATDESIEDAIGEEPDDAVEAAEADATPDDEDESDADATADETDRATDEDAADSADAPDDETEAGESDDRTEAEESDDETVDEIVEEAEGEAAADDEEPTGDAEGASPADDGVHETALFGEDSDDAGEYVDEAEGDDESEEGKKKGFFRRLLGLD